MSQDGILRFRIEQLEERLAYLRGLSSAFSGYALEIHNHDIEDTERELNQAYQDTFDNVD